MRDFLPSQIFVELPLALGGGIDGCRIVPCPGRERNPFAIFLVMGPPPPQWQLLDQSPQVGSPDRDGGYGLVPRIARRHSCR